jgi:uncharacterized surface protein with fasciclin (FAS1) repeats
MNSAFRTAAAAAVASLALASTAFAQTPATVVDIAVSSPAHTTLVAAVTAADLGATLSSAGPFTVFAPTNAAFGKLPAGTVDTLVKPENKATLTKILTYHVVAGKFTSTDLAAAAAAHGGTVVLTTVEGQKLTFAKHGMGWGLTDAKGGMAMISAADLTAGNGVVHVIDTVVMPG